MSIAGRNDRESGVHQAIAAGIVQFIQDSRITLRRLQVLTGIEKNRLWRIRRGKCPPTVDELHRILVAIDGRFDLHRLLMIWSQATSLTEEQIADSVRRFTDYVNNSDTSPARSVTLRVINDRGRGRLLVPVEQKLPRGA